MAMSNRDRVGRGFELLASGLKPFVDAQMRGSGGKQDWFDAYAANTSRGRELSLDDSYVLLNVVKHFWEQVFRKVLGRSDRTLVFGLIDARNRWAHNEAFTVDTAFSTLDSIEMLLTAVSANAQVGEVQRLKDELMRDRYAAQERQAAEGPTSITAGPVAGLPPWRDVVTPHDDVAKGTFQQAEFAADLAQVHRGEGAAEYVDPVEFFRRTYLTIGLRELLVNAVQRISGTGGQPVIDLQTTFGGGKTHSLLALYHVCAGRPVDELPAEARELLSSAGVQSMPAVRRAVLVGTALAPGAAEQKADGTVVNTLWGELAWQLGGAEGYALVADADRTRTNPGNALAELFRHYAPCLVLIDEWVAYARQLYSRDDLPGGSFDTHFTFAQTLTEAARAVPGTLAVISIPASEGRSGGEDETGSDIEVGGLGGREALKRLKSVVGRMEAAWRPASAEESFEIVRRRLFEPLTNSAVTQRDEVARIVAAFYRSNPADFPSECRDPGYARRLQAAYPIHPELFDRLYDDWSALDRFQRTRGVLRLMAAVVHALWARHDHAPLILPASLPLDDTVVRTELTRHLDDNWSPILDTDVDGPGSLPVQLDREVTNLGRYQAARRVARTVFLGSAPTLRSANRGIDAASVRLGCALPRESVATFGDALSRLSGRATYLYVDGGRYWYGTQPGVTRIAADRAQQYLTSERDGLQMEIERRARIDRDRGEFTGVHAMPSTSADVPDEPATRLVILPSTSPHIARSTETAALAAAREILERRGSAARERRNTLVFLAADHRRVEELEAAVADFLAWRSIDEEAGADGLNLDPHQARQARTKRDDSDRVVNLRLAETFQWALVPTQPDPTGPVTFTEVRVDGQGGLAARTSRKLVAGADLYTVFGPALLRMQLDGPLRTMWEHGSVEVRALWDAFTRYVYLPRLRDLDVLLSCVASGPASTTWQRDGFATADAYDTSVERFVGLKVGEHATATSATLVVQPRVALEQIEREHAAAGNTVEGAAHGAEPDALPEHEPRPESAPRREPVRFYGHVSLDPARVTRDFGKVSQEVVQHFVALEGANVEVVVEIRAHRPEGFDPTTVRTVSENARTLRFAGYDFEEE